LQLLIVIHLLHGLIVLFRSVVDIVGELVSQAKNGVAFMLKASTNLDFANNIINW
jgi:hypothetical protein